MCEMWKVKVILCEIYIKFTLSLSLQIDFEFHNEF